MCSADYSAANCWQALSRSRRSLESLRKQQDFPRGCSTPTSQGGLCGHDIQTWWFFRTAASEEKTALQEVKKTSLKTAGIHTVIIADELYPNQAFSAWLMKMLVLAGKGWSRTAQRGTKTLSIAVPSKAQSSIRVTQEGICTRFRDEQSSKDACNLRQKDETSSPQISKMWKILPIDIKSPKCGFTSGT